MKKLLTILSTGILLTSLSASVNCLVTDEIPLIESEQDKLSNWKKIPNVAQYKEADWSNVIGKAENINIQEAQRIADSDPRITFFFYVKGWQMVLEKCWLPSI